jgi:hypothetical protein
MDIFVFLTPQANNYSTLLGTDIKLDLVSTLKAIEKEKTVATYQTCFGALIRAANSVKGEVQVILSNGEVKKITEEYTVESIMELEKNAIKEVLDIPLEQLKQKNPINDIKTNAMDFYQAMYCEENKKQIEEDLIKTIKDTTEESTATTELDIIDKIILKYRIIGEVSEIICNGTKIENNDDFFKYLNRIIIDANHVYPGTVPISHTLEMNYEIIFSSEVKIVRKSMEFFVVKK